MLKIFLTNRWILLALLGLVFLNYYPALSNGWMIDDHLFREGRWAGGFQGYAEFLTRTESQHYSPLYFAVNYRLFEIFHEIPQALQLINILLFYASLVLFFGLTVLWTGSVPVAGITAALMAVHPIFGFPVGYKTANFVFYCAIFQQLSLYFLWRSAVHVPTSRSNTVLSIVFCALALLSNEWAVMLPAYAVLVMRCFGGMTWKEGCRAATVHFMLVVCFTVAYLTLAGAQAGLAERFFRLGFVPLEYAVTWLYFIAYYLSCVVPPRAGIFMTQVTGVSLLIWTGALLGMSAVAGGLAVLRKDISGNVPVFAWLWFLAGWPPVLVAMLGHPSLGLVFEQHWIFFASYGVFLFAARVLVAFGERWPAKISIPTILVLMVGLLFASIPLQRAMKSEKAFCEYWLRFLPPNRIPLATLGQIYYREGNHSEALKIFTELAAAADGQHFRELNNIGLIYHDLGRLDEAEVALRMALDVNPDFAPAWNNLGQVARDRSQLREAAAYFQAAVELDPHLPAARLNLAAILLTAGRTQQAADIMDPLDVRSLKTIYQREALMTGCLIALQSGDHRWRSSCDELHARFESAEMNLRLAQRMIDLPGDTLNHRIESVLTNTLVRYPRVKEVYLLLGTFYGNNEKWELAINTWRQGQERFPAEPLFGKFIAEAEKLRSRSHP